MATRACRELDVNQDHGEESDAMGQEVGWANAQEHEHEDDEQPPDEQACGPELRSPLEVCAHMPPHNIRQLES